MTTDTEVIRISLGKFNGVAPDKAIRVDLERGWFTIRRADLANGGGGGGGGGAAPTQIATKAKPRIAVSQGGRVVVRDPPDALPCVHRRNHIGDTPCGGCGNNRYVEAFACAKHVSCTIMRRAKDTRIRHCESCADRATGGIEIPFADYCNKYAGKTGYVVGRGATTFPDEQLAALDGPIFFINDAVLLEKFCPDNRDTFCCVFDKRMAQPQGGTPPLLSGLRSTTVLMTGSPADFEVNYHPFPGLGKVVRTIKTSVDQDWLLSLTREELRDERRLYRAPRLFIMDDGPDATEGATPTIVWAVHFAWYCGCDKLVFIRADGLPTGYAADLENRSDSPVSNVAKYAQARLDTEKLMRTLDMTYSYMGTPDLPEPPAAITDIAMIDFCTTTVDAPGRAELLDQTYTSFAAMQGVDLKVSTLYLNVDPAPGGGVGPGPSLAVAQRHFGNVIVNNPPTANFALAVKWCLSQGTTPYLFSLEDDWLLQRPASVYDLIAALERDDTLACCTLRAYNFRHNDTRICLSPGLWRAAYAKVLAERLTGDANPESQLRTRTADNQHGGKHDGYNGRQWPDDRAVKMIVDIGRPWIEKTRYSRPHSTGFVTWEA